MSTIRQTSFAAGELSPFLYGRTDIELFAHGARELTNWLVTPFGAVASRPGTRLLATAKVTQVVLIPFVFSETVSYVLELGAGYLRIHHPETGYTGVEITVGASWTADHLATIQWAQVGGVMTLTHTAWAPKELRAPQPPMSASWVLVDARFTPPGDAPTDTQSLVPVFITSTGAYRLSPMLVSPDGGLSLAVGDAQHPPRELRWKVSALLRNKYTAQEIETLPLDVIEYFDGVSRPTVFTIDSLTVDNLLVLYADRAVTLRNPPFGPIIGTLTGHANWDPVGIIYYRGKGRLFGFVGNRDFAGDFVDINEEPNYARQPLRGVNPFIGGTSNDYPGAVAFFGQRRAYGGTPQRPATMWASAIDNWANFDRPFPPYITDDVSLEATLTAPVKEHIRSFFSHRRLLAFTDRGVHSVGGESQTLTPTTVGFRREASVGATRLQPLGVDTAVLYVAEKGRGVQALLLSEGTDAYQARDAAWHAEHLFRELDNEVISWAFQKVPWSTVWAVRGDGAMLTGCRTSAGVWAWAKVETYEGDMVRSVACAPSGRADRVLMAVTRGASTYIEAVQQRDRATAIPLGATPGEASFALDCFSSFSTTTGVSYTATGLSRFEGRPVWAVAPGNAPQGPLVVTGGEVTLAPFDVANAGGSNVTVKIGLLYQCDLETLDAVAAGRLTQKAIASVGFEVDNAEGLQLGQDFDHLADWQQRSVADDYEFPVASSALARTYVQGSYKLTGRAVLRQPKPLPVMLLGITRELDVGGE